MRRSVDGNGGSGPREGWINPAVGLADWWWLDVVIDIEWENGTKMAVSPAT